MTEARETARKASLDAAQASLLDATQNLLCCLWMLELLHADRERVDWTILCGVQDAAAECRETLLSNLALVASSRGWLLRFFDFLKQEGFASKSPVRSAALSEQNSDIELEAERRI